MLTETVELVVMAACSLAGMVLLVRGQRALGGTTLAAAWWWMAACVAAVVAGEIGLAALGDAAAWARPVRYSAAVSTFCPLMSLMGAKRPQDRGWQFVVLTLWVVLALPAGYAVVQRAPGAVETHIVQAWFLALLIGIGLLNWLPTRAWGVGVALAAAQCLLLAEYLPFADRYAAGVPAAVPLALLVAGWAEWYRHVVRTGGRSAAAAGSGESTASAESSDGSDWSSAAAERARFDRCWRAFRDSFGAFWAVRLLVRMNDAAARGQADVRLGWSGLQRASGGPDSSRASRVAALARSFQSVLRQRFVSESWLDARLARREDERRLPAAASAAARESSA